MSSITLCIIYNEEKRMSSGGRRTIYTQGPSVAVDVNGLIQEMSTMNAHHHN